VPAQSGRYREPWYEGDEAKRASIETAPPDRAAVGVEIAVQLIPALSTHEALGASGTSATFFNAGPARSAATGNGVGARDDISEPLPPKCDARRIQPRMRATDRRRLRNDFMDSASMIASAEPC
jgi:hypothetical protein